MPAPRTTVCLLLCLSFVPTACAARLAMEQTGRQHAHRPGRTARAPRRARAYEIEQQEAFDELMFAKYAIIRKYLAKLPAHEQQAMQAELAKQHALFAYRYPDANTRLLGSNPHKPGRRAD